MTEQLTFTPQLIAVDGRRAWRIDAHTREIGRRGIAEARRALRRPAVDHDDATPTHDDAHPEAA